MPTGVAYPRWRINIRLNAGDAGFTQLAELQFRTNPAGSDQTSAGSGNGSTPDTIQAGTAAGVFANDASTTFLQWSGTTAKRFDYNFGTGSKQDINEMVVTGAVGAANRCPGEWDVQWSDDGTTWTTRWSVSSTSGWTTDVDRVFTNPEDPSLGAMGACRYWRIRALEAFSLVTDIIGVTEIEMKTTVGGTDQCTGGTAIGRIATLAFANAFDNNITTDGASLGVPFTEYLGYDFGSGVTKDIVEVTIRARNDVTTWLQSPRTFLVESSRDGEGWVERWRHTLAASDRPIVRRYIKPSSLPVAAAGKQRFWGIRVTACQSGTIFGISELEFRATAGGASTTTGGAGVSVLPFNSGTPANEGFDANTGTNYASANVPDVLAYDYGVGTEIIRPVQIAIKARSSSFTQSPTAFDLVSSSDGENWVTAASYTTPATWTASEIRLFGAQAPRRRTLITG